jgi:hypothetical protein
LLFLVGMIGIQGLVLPWVISNTVLPIWADLVILTGLLFFWVFIIDQLVSNTIRRLNNDTNKNKSI